jgi:hypothetical protein
VVYLRYRITQYAHFDRRDDGWTKVVLHPDGSR